MIFTRECTLLVKKKPPASGPAEAGIIFTAAALRREEVLEPALEKGSGSYRKLPAGMIKDISRKSILLAILGPPPSI